ncbi:uncharacterized protein LOC142354254 [Convolutriloba macropyga]|uniref:uncharacterized protein LOC142354254 n=1 Tax=Convolutriloba macropyga TaxID=536237 RepID=UPI003F523278
MNLPMFKHRKDKEGLKDNRHLLPSKCVTLKTTIFLFCRLFNPTNISELFLQVDGNSGSPDGNVKSLPTALEYIRVQLAATSVKVLNIQLGQGGSLCDTKRDLVNQMVKFIVNLIGSVSTLEVFTVTCNFLMDATELKILVQICLKEVRHDNLKVLILGSIPIILSSDITLALMDRIDYLTLKRGWTLREEMHTAKTQLIEFTSCI